jgi:hypothetical protein
MARKRRKRTTTAKHAVEITAHKMYATRARMPRIAGPPAATAHNATKKGPTHMNASRSPGVRGHAAARLMSIATKSPAAVATAGCGAWEIAMHAPPKKKSTDRA